MKSTRLIAMITGAAMAGLSLTACGGQSGSGDSGTVTYWLWDSAQVSAYQQCAKDFQKKNPNIKIKVVQKGWDDYWSAVTTGLVSGTAPDVFTNHLSRYGDFASKHQILPLDDLVKRDKVDLDIYEPGLADLWVGSDKQRYGLPKDWDTVGLFYNKKMLKDAGLSEKEMKDLTWNPEDGGTYEKVIARLTVDANGKRGDEPGFDKSKVKTYGLWMEGAGDGVGQTQWSMYTGTTGWKVTDKNPWGTHFNYDDPRFQKTISWWKGLVDKGYMPSFKAQEGVQWSDQLAAGKAAMATNGDWMTNTVYGYKNLSVGIAPTPIGPSGKRAGMFNGLADSIYAGTKNKEGAWKWVKYLASPDCQNVVGEKGVVFPAVTSAWKTAQTAFEAKGIDVAPFTDHVKNKTTFLFPITDHAADVSAIMTPAMEAVMSGKAPVSSLTGANKKVNDLFK